jgi:hypothetical protein
MLVRVASRKEDTHKTESLELERLAGCRDMFVLDIVVHGEDGL